MKTHDAAGHISPTKVEIVLSYARSFNGEFTAADLRGIVGGPTAVRNALQVLRNRGDIELLTASGKGHVGRWRVTQPAPIRPDQRSLRSRVIAALDGNRYADIRALEAAIRLPGDNFGHHELMHIVHSLGKQGIATFEERKQGNGAQHELLSIRLRAKPPASGPPVRIEPVNAPEPDEPVDDSPQREERATRADTSTTYPVIGALLRRSTEIALAAKHLEAAGLDDLALATLAKADDLTPLEREVLRYFLIEREGSEVPTSQPSSVSAHGETAGTST